MFKIIMEVTFMALIVITLITQILIPMFCNLNYFWIFNRGERIEVGQILHIIKSDYEQKKKEYKSAEKEVDTAIESLTKIKKSK